MLFAPATGRVRRAVLTGACGLAAAALLAGCAGPAETDETGGSGSFDVSVEHAFGTTEITERPERIVTVGWSDEGTLLELGITPVGMTETAFGAVDGYLPWDTEKIEELGTEPPELINMDAGIPVEQVANLAPDLILGVQSGMLEEEYAQLSEVAPTIPYLYDPWTTPWQEQTLTIGRAVGQEAQAQELVEETEAYVAEVAAEHPEFEGVSYAAGTVMLQENQFGFYVEGDTRPALMEALGFVPSGVPDTLDLPEGSFYGTLSLERADEIDAEVLVMWYNTAEEQAQVDENPTFEGVEAVANGGYLGISDQSISMAMSTPSPLSLPWVLERVDDDLAAAAAGEL